MSYASLMHKFEISGAVPSQAKEICTVLRRSITEVCGPDYGNDHAVLEDWLSNKTPENVASWISEERSCSLVAKRGAEIVGFALLKEGEILLNYVAPEYIGKGAGAQMLSALEYWARSQGISELYCNSSITAKPFYERNGFKSSGEPGYVGGVLGEFPLCKHVGI